VNRVPPVTRVYFAALLAAALFAMWDGFSRDAGFDARGLIIGALLGGALALAQRTALPFGLHSHIHLDTAVVLAGVLILPPGPAIATAFAGALLANAGRKVDWAETIFNSSQTALQAAIGAAMLTVGGFWHGEDPFSHPSFLVALLFAGVSMHLVNTATVAMIFAIQGEERPWAAWTRLATPDLGEASGLVAQWGLALLAAIVSQAYIWALALLMIPGLLLLGSLQRHVRLRVRAEDTLTHQAYHDSLTGLPNRTLLLERIEAALAESPQRGLALLFLDLDRFKLVNDTLGHEAGDKLLIEVAARLRTCIGANDTVARLGGDEFVVLLTTTSETAEDVAARIADQLARPIRMLGREILVTTSIGISHSNGDQLSASDLLRNADIALYRAKDNGRDQAARYVDEMGDQVTKLAALEQGLRQAIAHDELRLAFQPQVDLATGDVVSLEALLRWEHPERGLLTPSDFLQTAEETGLLLPAGRWVLLKACQVIHGWTNTEGVPLSVGVNVSARQLASPMLLDDVRDALRASGLPAHRLRLEVSEHAVMEDPVASQHILSRLSGLGVAIVLDDFGSGRSSLAHLARLPVNLLVLDKALVDGLRDDQGAETVIRAVISLSRELGIRVGAKGVECREQARALQAFGCQFGQGHWFGYPRIVDESLVRFTGGYPPMSGNDFLRSSAPPTMPPPPVVLDSHALAAL
jgi:diguanylate cyclase (GGDEF)-like protein